MQKLVVLLFSLSCIVSCKDKKDDPAKEKDPVVVNTDTATQPKPPVGSETEKLLGSFVGAFGDNKITLLITKAEGDSVIGRSIVGGNDRPFAGTFINNGGIYTVTAKEPGDHKDDGMFSFALDIKTPDNLEGEWKPNDTKRPVKEYKLERKKFTYNPSVGDYPEASERLLKAKDVENLYKQDLEFMRNEIFARHGYCFKKKHLRQEFEMQSWYVPNTVDIKGFLTDIEKKNIELIKRYEKYADEYGDEYGR